MPVNFLSIADIMGTFAFAASGASLAMSKKLDVFGVLVLAFVTAIGGGTLRDLLIGNLPVSWLTNEVTIIVIICAAFISMFFHHYLHKLPQTLFLFDAIGLGLFTLTGIEMAIEKSFSAGICIALGTITACFGGVIRDVLLNQVPLIFRKEVYAMACVAGGVLYFLLRDIGLDSDALKIVCITLIVTIRILAVKYHWYLPKMYPPAGKQNAD